MSLHRESSKTRNEHLFESLIRLQELAKTSSSQKLLKCHRTPNYTPKPHRSSHGNVLKHQKRFDDLRRLIIETKRKRDLGLKLTFQNHDEKTVTIPVKPQSREKRDPRNQRLFTPKTEKFMKFMGPLQIYPTDILDDISAKYATNLPVGRYKNPPEWESRPVREANFLDCGSATDLRSKKKILRDIKRCQNVQIRDPKNVEIIKTYKELLEELGKYLS